MIAISNLVFSSSDDSDSEEPKRRKIYRPRINYSELSDFVFKEKFRLNTEEVE
jgi:hypothetical protein